MFPHSFGERLSGGRFQIFRWVEYVGIAVTTAIARGNARIIVNLPPRHGKSEFFSKWLPIWFLEQHPSKHVMLVSHESDFATGLGRVVRDEFETNPMLITKLREDVTAAGRWKTRENGGMYCAGIGGSITGRGFNLGIIDDPIKNSDEANSPLVHRKHREWYRSTFATRGEPNSSIVVVQHRWHENDLAGFLLEDHEQEWSVIKLPAIAEENDPMGRAVGEPLCPERFDLNALTVQRAGVGEDVWVSMYQQRPKDVGVGRLYGNFEAAMHLDHSLELRDDLPLHMSIDFNINPGMHMLLGQYDERREYFTAVYEVHGPRMNVISAIEDVRNIIAELVGCKPESLSAHNSTFKWPEMHVFGDPAGSSEWAATGESQWAIVMNALRRFIPVVRRRVMAAHPGVVDRINAFNETLRDWEGKTHYAVHPRCERLINDFKNMRTGEDGLPDKKDRSLSHASDAEGYRIHYLRPLAVAVESSAAGQCNV